MLISTKGRYALRVMAELAQCPGDTPVPLRDIAERQGISEKYLEAILKKLVQAGLVSGTRGKGGGYILSCDPATCTVRRILEAAEDTLAPIACGELTGESCARAQGCVTLPMWKELDRRIKDFFDSITLQQLLQKKE
ncbi:RrF2 family transcriptional regulator [Intestinibacillus sp. Marseille-P6563]|uniref:RrF2 family transcriptional regulator n=1 Tax=Intestinibacillus sp. Marseille-P6563 TaxID=2364792 RepID=UPI000F05C30C|nr:Rrf2 family transcriptional regulator [Intestinibacillus sp. Marseille-P6563]